jgi:hypothetical protein
MASNIDAIALVVDSPGNASHVPALFQDDGDEAGSIKQFERRRKPSRTSANDHGPMVDFRLVG